MGRLAIAKIKYKIEVFTKFSLIEWSVFAGTKSV